MVELGGARRRAVVTMVMAAGVVVFSSPAWAPALPRLAEGLLGPRVARAQPSDPDPTPPPGLPSGPKQLDPAVVEPDPTTREARRLLGLASPEEARVLLETAIRNPSAAPAEVGRHRWLLAELHAAAKRSDEALAVYSALAASDHPLARWASLRHAELLVEKRPAEALAALDTLAGDWAGGPDARILRARAHLRAGDKAAGIAALRAMLGRAPASSAAAAIAMPLAAELASHKSADDREEAVRLYRRVATRLADTQVGSDAEAQIKALTATLPPKARARVGSHSAEDWMTLGETFMRLRRYKDAEHAFLKAAKRLGPAAGCAAEYEAVRAVFQRRERDASAKRFDKLRKRCRGGDVYAKATFLAGRSYALIGNFPEALKRYDVVLKETRDHALADDALFRASLALEELGAKESEVLDRLRRIVREFPAGDMAPEARFRLAWAALKRGDHEAALEDWRALEARGDTPSEDAYGRYAYWRARTLEVLRRSAEAAGAYEQLALAWPLAFYAQLSVERLRALDAARADRVLASWRGEREPTLTLPWRSEFEGPTFARALELLRVGETTLAEKELTNLGALGEGADARWTWTAAALFDRAGEPSRTVNLLRRRQRYYRGSAPVGRAYAEWRLAYPRAFAPLIDDTAAKEGVPAAFVRAIAREESSFTPTAVSPAQAYGMIQVILPTAKRWGSELGITVTPEKLKDPAVNVPVGVHFMQYLWRRYSTNPAVVPAAYNAGNAAVDRWLKERSTEPLDEWIENIPYDETQRYTRRVLQSYGVYQWLEDGTLPSRSLVIPPAP